MRREGQIPTMNAGYLLCICRLFNQVEAGLGKTQKLGASLANRL